VRRWHIFLQFGISANPLTMFVAAAQHTKQLRFRTLCYTLSLYHAERFRLLTYAYDSL
jgi:hypothetical protein